MEFNYSYKGSSGVSDRGKNTEISFAPDSKRPPTFFIGELRQNVAFREAISALHDVVVSDLRYKPRDTTAYKDWRAQQDDIDWQLVAAQRQEVAIKIQQLQTELNELNKLSRERLAPFYAAKQKFFQYLYTNLSCQLQKR
jgi:hypothetical protein